MEARSFIDPPLHPCNKGCTPNLSASRVDRSSLGPSRLQGMNRVNIHIRELENQVGSALQTIDITTGITSWVL